MFQFCCSRSRHKSGGYFVISHMEGKFSLVPAQSGDLLERLMPSNTKVSGTWNEDDRCSFGNDARSK